MGGGQEDSLRTSRIEIEGKSNQHLNCPCVRLDSWLQDFVFSSENLLILSGILKVK